MCRLFLGRPSPPHQAKAPPPRGRPLARPGEAVVTNFQEVFESEVSVSLRVIAEASRRMAW